MCLLFSMHEIMLAEVLRFTFLFFGGMGVGEGVGVTIMHLLPLYIREIHSQLKYITDQQNTTKASRSIPSLY